MVDKVEKAVAWAQHIAADPSHGYDQLMRWGPDYDCSSLVISAFEYGGIPVKTGGAVYTGNMRSVFLRHGFRDVTASVDLATGRGCVRGDVLLNEAKHTAIYLGNGAIVHASANEHYKATGGQTGDQTGGEICERSYYNSPWDCVLRYATVEDPAQAPTGGMVLPILRKGSTRPEVTALQMLLKGHGYDPGEIDSDFGKLTRAALVQFQTDIGIDADGECGPITWGVLLHVEGWS